MRAEIFEYGPRNHKQIRQGYEAPAGLPLMEQLALQVATAWDVISQNCRIE
jgi:hypothetical protein